MTCLIVLIRRKRRLRHQSFRRQPRSAAEEVGEHRGRYIRRNRNRIPIRSLNLNRVGRIGEPDRTSRRPLSS
jgi:hypothetical protein